MRVRPFAPSDADALAAIFHLSVHRVAIRHYSRDQVAAWSPSEPDTAGYLLRASGNTLLVAAAEAGTILGYGDLAPNGHLDHLYCHPDAVGRGVGRAIYAELEGTARAWAIPAVFVEASEGARGFFVRRGFTCEGRNSFFLRSVAIHNYRMTKAIT